MVELSPAGHGEATHTQGQTGRPGVAEQMLKAAGLVVVDRGTADVVNELPDLDLAVRALAAAGPSWPAIQNVGYDRFADAVRQTLIPLYVEGIGVRIVSEFGWIIGKVPAT
jgi:hypothetical protein